VLRRERNGNNDFRRQFGVRAWQRRATHRMSPRLRQICLVAPELDAAIDTFHRLFGLPPCHRGSIDTYGLYNALFAFGHQFVEIDRSDDNEDLDGAYWPAGPDWRKGQRTARPRCASTSGRCASSRHQPARRSACAGWTWRWPTRPRRTL